MATVWKNRIFLPFLVICFGYNFRELLLLWQPSSFTRPDVEGSRLDRRTVHVVLLPVFLAQRRSLLFRGISHRQIIWRSSWCHHLQFICPSGTGLCWDIYNTKLTLQQSVCVWLCACQCVCVCLSMCVCVCECQSLSGCVTVCNCRLVYVCVSKIDLECLPTELWVLLVLMCYWGKVCVCWQKVVTNHPWPFLFQIINKH